MTTRSMARPASDHPPLTDAQRIGAEILIMVADHKIADVRIALDLVDRLLSTLKLGPDQRLSDGRDDRDIMCDERLLH
jgi:hypothetical protein